MKRIAIIGASGAIGKAFTSFYAEQESTETVFSLSRTATDYANPKVVNSHLDLEEPHTIARVVQEIPDGSLDLVIVATGILHAGGKISVQPEKSLQQLEEDALVKTFMINCIGPALVLKHFLPLLRKDARSMFAALSARVGSISDNRLGGWYGYRASKAALNMLIKTAAIEMRRQNPSAIIIGLHPGTVDSNLSRPFQARVPEGQLFTPETAVSQMAAVLDNLKSSDSGKCIAWDGKEIPA